jgi:HK97 family phage prohead protease
MHGCHTTKASAIKQAVAISLSTKEPFKGERSVEVSSRDDIAVGDYIKWDNAEGECEYGEVYEINGEIAVVKIYDEEEGQWWETNDLATVWLNEMTKIPPLNVVELSEPADIAPDPTRDANDKWIRAAWLIKAQIEGIPEARSLGKAETRTNHMELRATGDGMTFEGYAAVFNSKSEPLPFTEVIKPGAFKRSLQGRHRMMLLWNHNASEPLASTRNGSLKMVEDARGLKVTAKIADTSTGRDVAELIRSGVIDAMSFGFQVKKDSWSADGNTRTLEEIALHEVSLVSFPAYEGTAGTTSVREMRNIDADQLADSLMKLESGEELNPEQAQIINSVVEKLTKTEEVQEVEGDILALKKKKLDLILKGI